MPVLAIPLVTVLIVVAIACGVVFILSHLR
jgi:hypothetical protein